MEIIMPDDNITISVWTYIFKGIEREICVSIIRIRVE